MMKEIIGWKEVNIICQTIAGELALNDLLARLREVMLIGLRARRGILLLLERDGYLVAVQASPDEPKLAYVPFTQLEKAVQSRINQVIGTRQKVVLKEKGVTFVVVPLVFQGRLMGICYLEMLVFDEDMQEKLEVVLAQTAVSLTNARRFAEVKEQARLLEGEEVYRRMLQQKVAERTAEIEQAMQQLKITQDQLIVQEKLASLGSLASGIAHEIKNPLNFVNNFAAMTVELVQELRQIVEVQEHLLEAEASEEIVDLLSSLEFNANKIQEQGKRADSIVRSMLLHSRGQGSERELVDVNDLLAEAVHLAYHGARQQTAVCDIRLEQSLAANLPAIKLVPQDISRVFVNIISNAVYAVQDKFRDMGEGYAPAIWVSSRELAEWVEIRIGDNGPGIPENDRDEVFTPFFSTKPTGEGTGLGLSLSYNIVVQGHQGKLEVQSELEQYTEFIIRLPKVV